MVEKRRPLSSLLRHAEKQVGDVSERKGSNVSGCYISFLVRFYRESGPGTPGSAANWRGEIEHIQTGKQHRFESLEEMFKYLRHQLSALEAGQT